jgi:peroxiredoxin
MIKRTKLFLNKTVLLSLIAFSFFSVAHSQKASSLKNGIWRATINRADGRQIPFTFQTKDSAGKKIIYVINGKEHLLVDSVETYADSVFIQMPFFESGFKARILNDGNLEGVWLKQYGKRTQILPFTAIRNEERFTTLKHQVANISGRWSTDFVENNHVTNIVGEFIQKGSYLTGTFLDPTGDYRFLEGVVSGDSLKLSTFDGAHAYLFIAKIDDTNTISGGKFYSGARSIEDWSAKRNENAKPENEFEMTKLKPGAGKLNFTFQNSNDGKEVSINDKRFKNKVVLVQILGSWCPNCMDETKFLSDYYNKNHSKGLEIIGLAYERTADFKTSQKDLLPFKKRFHVQYPILITSVTVADTLKTEKTLPQLESINAFPTTIFVDKKGNIRKIQAGFSGPATGEHYIEFKKEFNQIINELLSEK